MNLPGITAALTETAARALARARLLAIAGVVGLFALGFLSLSLYLALATRITPPEAAAVTGLGLAAIAGAILLLAWRRPPPQARPALDVAELSVTIQQLNDAVQAQLKSNAPNLTLAALVAGCALGYSPALRRLLRDLAR